MMNTYPSSSSNNSNDASSRMLANNTACYDPISKCITLPSDDEEGGGMIRSILGGSIIEFDEPNFQCGQMLLGEIYEIGEYTCIFISCLAPF